MDDLSSSIPINTLNLDIHCRHSPKVLEHQNATPDCLFGVEGGEIPLVKTGVQQSFQTIWQHPKEDKHALHRVCATMCIFLFLVCNSSFKMLSWPTEHQTFVTKTRITTYDNKQMHSICFKDSLFCAEDQEEEASVRSNPFSKK
mmetsp:Transcript_15930/g.24814  ORF Transcript_15930/g.24814 Transcript_15930/m.24814 type:complete len:144 (-) Transcript_15930:183-614(-)